MFSYSLLKLDIMKNPTFSLYLATAIIYNRLDIDRLKTCLKSIQDLGEDLEDFIFINNDTDAIHNGNKFNLSNIKPFDNLPSLKAKLADIALI